MIAQVACFVLCLLAGAMGFALIWVKKEKVVSSLLVLVSCAFGFGATIGFDPVDDVAAGDLTSERLPPKTPQSRVESAETAPPVPVDKMTEQSRVTDPFLRTDADYLAWSMAAFRADDAMNALRYAHVGLSRPLSSIRVEAALTHRMATALDALGLSAQGVEMFRSSSAIDPTFSWPHNNLGNILRRQGELQEAETEYRTAIELDSKVPAFHSNLGHALKEQGKLQEAETEYRAAIEFESKDSRLHYNLGKLLKEQGKLEEAEAEYRMAIELNPKDHKSYYKLATVLEKQGHLEEVSSEKVQGNRLGN